MGMRPQGRDHKVGEAGSRPWGRGCRHVSVATSEVGLVQWVWGHGVGGTNGIEILGRRMCKEWGTSRWTHRGGGYRRSGGGVDEVGKSQKGEK